jgi:hypothetical protein
MTIIKARPTLYKGIQMRSRLEADFAAFLDRTGDEWEYEPTCFAGPDGQWLPDFCVLAGEDLIYFEVKPESLRTTKQIDAVLAQMRVAWLTEPDAILQLVVWSYREPRHSHTVMGIPPKGGTDLTWWHSEGAGKSQVWPGMGQIERLIREMPLDDLNRLLDETKPSTAGESA